MDQKAIVYALDSSQIRKIWVHALPWQSPTRSGCYRVTSPRERIWARSRAVSVSREAKTDCRRCLSF